jgi:hypothetical protein
LLGLSRLEAAFSFREQCAANALSTFVPYFYTREWWDQNIDTPEAYTNWRNKRGEYYLDIQDSRDLYYRMMAAGSGWAGDTPGFNGDFNAVLRRHLPIESSRALVYQPRRL